MKKSKLFKTLLIPSLGVLTIGTISVVATGCGCALEPTPVIHVESVTLNEISVVLHAGKTKTLIATALPENATDKSVTWTSSDTNVATVDSNGTITAVGLGNATIIVITSDGGKTATCAVTVVEPIHVESVTLDKHNLSLEVGGNDYLTATVSPADATDQSVSWASDNETVATVDENGKVTAVSVGTANITVTTRDGGKTDTCEVTVTLPYVCLEANANSTLTFVHDYVGDFPDLQYSTDNGTSWNTYSEEISISQGQTLLLKGNNPEGWSHSKSTYSYLQITIGDVSISGNVMGLLDNGATSGEEGNITAIPCDYCFYDLFRNSTGITSVSDDFLPATVLKNNCYRYMFNSCSSLTAAPKLPATSLAENCYRYMFNSCSSLTAAPELPATTLVNGCYSYMFYNCASLTTAPKLPATTLATSCYECMFYGCTQLTTAPNLLAKNLAESCCWCMFYGCTQLTTAPALPATSLAKTCYKNMFYGCKSLTQAPELPGTELKEGCYSSMFQNCTSLTVAPKLPATNLALNCYSNMFNGCASLNSVKIDYTRDYIALFFEGWVKNVASSGTFYYKGSQSAQNFGFPSGWTTKSSN